MTRSEMAMLSAIVHSLQGGESTRLEVEAWYEVIGDLDYEDAAEAVKAHFRAESRRIMPADVRRRVSDLYGGDGERKKVIRGGSVVR